MKRVILWTTPRSLSTAFYRCMTTLRDTRTKCLFEQFCMPYYFGPPAVRRSSRYEILEDAAIKDMVIEPTYNAVKEFLQQDFADIDLVFAKEFAFCLPKVLYEEMAKLPGVQHTFLIRDPKKAISSYFKTSNSLTYKDEFYQSEAGFKELCEFYRLVKQCNDTSPIVVDADDLQAHPAETLELYCSGIGVPFEQHMTSWEPGSVPGMNRCWEEWVTGVEKSSGFIRVDCKKQVVSLEGLPREICDCIDNCQQYYEEMVADRIHI